MHASFMTGMIMVRSTIMTTMKGFAENANQRNFGAHMIRNAFLIGQEAVA